MALIWNQIVEDGEAFPQLDLLSDEEASTFFASQTYTGCAVDEWTGEVVGLYILHPNNIGRVGHIGNCSYCVERSIRGEHIGDKLVQDSLRMAKESGFHLIQFNAVVYSNIHARHLYERNGFIHLGTIPGGFRMKDGHYEDICLYYHTL